MKLARALDASTCMTEAAIRLWNKRAEGRE